ncbi:MAG: hypothetical protein NTX79_02755 [Candidatus Micrarchaeota archaeon]|nr:hypothetical protein [Candidatus Micrarchaeota archaeon]
MTEIVAALTLLVRLANLVLAGYLLSILAPLYRAEKYMSFSRTVHIMLIAIVLFLAVGMIQVFGLMPQDVFEPVQAFFSFIFLLLLIAAMLEVKKGMMAHDHMMRRKLREKMHDVE